MSFLNNKVTVRSSLCLVSELITHLVLSLSKEQREPFLMWTIFKVFVESATILLLFYILAF